MIKKLIGKDYPKTSCECSECPPFPEKQPWPFTDKIYDVKTNNLGLQNCEQLKDIKDCISISSIATGREPSPWLKNNAYEILNPNFGMGYSPGFFHTKNADCACPPKYAKTAVTALDARLIDAPRNQRLELDRPPFTGNVPLDDIYNENMTNYGKNYSNYQSVNGGQIMYYIDNDIKPTYHLPVFTIRSKVDYEVLETPMGGLWPQYPKQPLTKDSRYISPQQFTRDTVFQREDIMSKQIARFSREAFPV